MVWKIIGWVFVPFIMLPTQWRRMRSNGARIAGSIWAVLFLVIALHDGFSHPAAQPALASVPKAQTHHTAQTLKLVQTGQVGSIGSLQVKVGGVQESKTIGQAGIGTTANGEYWLFKVTVKNTGNAAQTIDGSMFSLYGNGKTYNSDDSAAIYLPNGNILAQQLNPGVSLTGYIVFDMPAYATSGNIGEHYYMIVSSGILGTSQQKFALP